MSKPPLYHGRPQKRQGHGQAHQIQPPAHVSTPYRYVPISPWIYQPEWGSDVSIDRPIADGVSGTIEIELTANGEFLVGSGPDEKRNVRFFTMPDGTKAIPGSTLKGAMRAFLEIAAFGRATFIADMRKGVRDMSGALSPLYQASVSTGRLTAGGIPDPETTTVKSGWLFQGEDGRPRIRPCKVPFRKFPAEDRIPRGSLALEDRLNAFAGDAKVLYVRTVPIDGIRWIIVVTNAVGRKRHEFLFEDPFTVDGGSSLVEAHDDLDRLDTAWINFLAFNVFHQSAKNDPSRQSGWQFWKEYYYAGKPVPVFFITDAQGNLTDFGMAGTFKIAHTQSIHENIRAILGDCHLDSTLDDLPALMFGSISDDDEKLNRRGRFAAEPLRITHEVPAKGRTVLLSSPKDGFYVADMMQPTVNGRLIGRTYATLSPLQVKDKLLAEPRLAGRAVYPTQKTPVNTGTGENAEEKQEIGSMQSVLHPVGEGSTFAGRIRFHNVRKEELGAMLWALTWGGNDKLVHRIGMGKPLGMGKCTLTVTKLLVEPNAITRDAAGRAQRPARADRTDKVGDYRKCFEQNIEAAFESAHRGQRWSHSDALRMFQAMADSETRWGKAQELLSYMEVKQFAAIKRERLTYLPNPLYPVEASFDALKARFES